MQYSTAVFPDLYDEAIANSMYPTREKVQPLLAITRDNPLLRWKNIQGEDHVLMLTWKSRNFYPDSGLYNTGNYEIWVSAVPELYRFVKGVKASKRDIRIKQLLGLPPNGRYTTFIEFWVRPADLFRPCPDKEIHDSICNTCFNAADSLDAAHIQWFNTGRIDRYYACDLYSRYPWTQLGYTYDWNPRNRQHHGVSEFVIGKNKNIYVHKVYNDLQYFEYPWSTAERE